MIYDLRKTQKASILLAILAIFTLQLSPVLAQTLTSAGSVDVTQPGFKIIICNGPAALNELPAHQVPDPNDPTGKKMIPFPTGWVKDQNFIACDFNGAMKQVQHLIDIAMVLGVLAAIVLFTYAGYLYITGTEGNIKKAKSIFPKVFFGFVIMLVAWFVVYQLLIWLTGNSGFTKLLGSP